MLSNCQYRTRLCGTVFQQTSILEVFIACGHGSHLYKCFALCLGFLSLGAFLPNLAMYLSSGT